MSKFYCETCQKDFEAEGVKKESKDLTFGPCWKRTAQCPDCGGKRDESRKKGSPKKGFNFESYVSNLMSQGKGCTPGGGCCG